MRAISFVVYLIALLLWAIVGVWVWIPLMFRMIAAFVAVVFASRFTTVDLQKAQAALNHAIRLYADGFKTILDAMRGNPLSPSKQIEDTDWARVLREVAFAAGFWLMGSLLWFIVHWVSQPSRPAPEAIRSPPARPAPPLAAPPLPAPPPAASSAPPAPPATSNKESSLAFRFTADVTTSIATITRDDGSQHGTKLKLNPIRLWVARESIGLFTTEERAQMRMSVCNDAQASSGAVTLSVWYTNAQNTSSTVFENKYISRMRISECSEEVLSSTKLPPPDVFKKPLGILHVSLDDGKTTSRINFDDADQRGWITIDTTGTTR